jgi:hypothetical protein
MQPALKSCEDSKLAIAAAMLRARASVRIKAWGTSMFPAVRPGDLLTIQSAAYDQVVPGDIVLVMRDHRFFVHRLVERRQVRDCISLVTRGDAMPHNDPPAATSELLGRVACIRRGNHCFVPRRRLLPLHSALAWMLCRSVRFSNLTLRIDAAILQARPVRAAQFFRRAFGGISPLHRFHP